MDSLFEASFTMLSQTGEILRRPTHLGPEHFSPERKSATSTGVDFPPRSDGNIQPLNSIVYGVRCHVEVLGVLTCTGESSKEGTCALFL